MLRDTARATLGCDARAKVEIWRRRREGGGRVGVQRQVEEEERLRGGERLASRGGREAIRLGDDSPMLDIYSIGVEGGRGGGGVREGRENGLGGVQDDITVPVDREWR